MARDLCWACVVKGLTRRDAGAGGWQRRGGIGYRRLSLAAAGVSALTLYDTRPDVAYALAGRLHQHYPQLDITP